MAEKGDNSAVPQYEEIDHPSDIGLRFWGGSMETLFANAAAGMFSLITDTGKVRPVTSMNVELLGEDEDYEGLLVLWLEKLLYYFEVESMVFSEIRVDGVSVEKDGAGLKAVLYGEKLDGRRHRIAKVIKAPTYHMLSITKKEGYWEGRVIFDV